MAQTLVTLLSHIVFSTKCREPFIDPEIETPLYRYMDGIVANLGSRCLAINGVADHVHMLVSMSKTLALSDFMRELKSSSTRWLKQQDRRWRYFGWQDGYGAFSVGQSNVPAVVDYIARQKVRHRRMTFEAEYLALARKYELEFDERYLFD